MKKVPGFAPQSYLKTVQSVRRSRFKQTAFIIFVVCLVVTSAVSATTYASSLSDFLRKSSEPQYRIVNRPDEKPTVYEDIEEEVTTESSDEAYPEDEYYDEEYDYIGENACNVLGISISGDLGTDYGDTSSDFVRDILAEYGNDERIKSILVSVDSGGGSPVAGDEIATLLDEQTVPVVAQVREIGASAAYMAILPADYIFAHRYGSVGSIGVIIPLYDYSKFNEREGIEYTPIKTSPSKDAGTPDRPLTKEERAALQQEIDFIYEEFVKDVAYYRNMSYERVKQVADGTTMLSHKAKEVGLIDAVGGKAEVTDYLRGITKEEPVVCWPDYIQ